MVIAIAGWNDAVRIIVLRDTEADEVGFGSAISSSSINRLQISI